MDRGEINVDPVRDEFFKAQDLADALVRESIQNSLDARRGNSTVRVRFRFASLPAGDAVRYMFGLDPHPAAATPHALQLTHRADDDRCLLLETWMPAQRSLGSAV